MSFIGDLFGGSPKVDSTAVEDLTEEERKAKKARTALYATNSGVLGEELEAGTTTKRGSLLGN